MGNDASAYVDDSATSKALAEKSLSPENLCFSQNEAEGTIHI